MTTKLEHPAAETGDTTSVDICARLSELGETCRTESKFYREALRAVAGHFGSPYAVIRITKTASTLVECVTSELDDAGSGTIWHGMTGLVRYQAEPQTIGVRLYRSALRFLNKLRT